MTKTYEKHDNYTLKTVEIKTEELHFPLEQLLAAKSHLEIARDDIAAKLADVSKLISEAQKLGIKDKVEKVLVNGLEEIK